MSDEWSEGEVSVADAGSRSLRCYVGRLHLEIRTPSIYSYETLSLHLLIFSVASGGLLRNTLRVVTTSVCNTYLLGGSTNA